MNSPFAVEISRLATTIQGAFRRSCSRNRQKPHCRVFSATVVSSSTDGKPVRTVPNRVAFFELSYNCNFCCPFCYVPWLDYPELYGRPLTKKQWLEAVDKVILEGYDGIQLCGGEPSLNSDFEAIVSFIVNRHSNIPLCIFTNGSCFTDRFLATIEGKNAYIVTSLQGTKTRDAMTGYSSSLSEWENGCKRVRKHNIALEFQLPITKQNLPELNEMLDLCASFSPICIQVNPLVVEGRAKYHPDLWLSMDDRHRISNIVEQRKQFSSFTIIVEPELYCVERTDSIVPDGCLQPIIHRECEKCKRDIVIGPDGRRRNCLHATKCLV